MNVTQVLSFRHSFAAYFAQIALFSSLSLMSCNTEAQNNTQFEQNLPNPRQESLFPRVATMPLPEKISFAGENVPLDNEDVKERLEREIIHNSYKLSATLLILKREGRWKKQIQAILRENEVPEDFFYLAVAESELDIYAMSAVGAHGFWQFMKATGKEFGLEISDQVDQRRDVIEATKAACKYLKQAHKKFGNWTLVAASYNRGMAGMDKALATQKQNSYYDLYLNQETYRYIFRILALKVIMQNPQLYGFHLAENEKYKPFETQPFQVNATIVNLADFAKEHQTTYQNIKKLNPWLDDNNNYKLIVSKEKYVLQLPIEKK
jgi:membrane-bound lytic murein transglycosylase D